MGEAMMLPAANCRTSASPRRGPAEDRYRGGLGVGTVEVGCDGDVIVRMGYPVVQPDGPLSIGSRGITGSVSFRAAICPHWQAK